MSTSSLSKRSFAARLGRARQLMAEAEQQLIGLAYPGGVSDQTLGDLARQLYAERRARDALLGEVDLGEPTWDMLLALYIARAEGRAMRVTDACIASGGPATTALRHLARLEAQGVITRRKRGKKEFLVELSDEIVGRIDAFLRGAAS